MAVLRTQRAEQPSSGVVGIEYVHMPSLPRVCSAASKSYTSLIDKATQHHHVRVLISRLPQSRSWHTLCHFLSLTRSHVLTHVHSLGLCVITFTWLYSLRDCNRSCWKSWAAPNPITVDRFTWIKLDVNAVLHSLPGGTGCWQVDYRLGNCNHSTVPCFQPHAQ